MKRYRINTISTLCAALTLLHPCATMAAPIPLNLSRPDGAPGNMTKKVKVYILAGQSNMVGMGDVRGARPPYPTVYLSADPAVISGATPIGRIDNYRAHDWLSVARHGVFDAKAAVYAGPYDPAKQPQKTATVALGTVAEKLPATEGTQTVVVTAQIDVPDTGTYTVHAGFEDSTHVVVLLDGKEVYRKECGGTTVTTKVTLEQGKRYPVMITYFRGGSAAFWLRQEDIPGKGDLVTVTHKDKKFPYLLDDAGGWRVRNDVSYTDPRLFPERKSSPLSPTSNNGKAVATASGLMAAHTRTPARGTRSTSTASCWPIRSAASSHGAEKAANHTAAMYGPNSGANSKAAR